MKYDDYKEVINHPDTYKKIADDLKAKYSVLVGWTDQNMTHLDILFTTNVSGYGTHQGGISPADLFVSIMRRGAFGFETNRLTHSGYYDEKLGGGLGSTQVEFAELINEVKKLL